MKFEAILFAICCSAASTTIAEQELDALAAQVKPHYPDDLNRQSHPDSISYPPAVDELLIKRFHHHRLEFNHHVATIPIVCEKCEMLEEFIHAECNEYDTAEILLADATLPAENKSRCDHTGVYAQMLLTCQPGVDGVNICSQPDCHDAYNPEAYCTDSAKNHCVSLRTTAWEKICLVLDSVDKIDQCRDSSTCRLFEDVMEVDPEKTSWIKGALENSGPGTDVTTAEVYIEVMNWCTSIETAPACDYGCGHTFLSGGNKPSTTQSTQEHQLKVAEKLYKNLQGGAAYHEHANMSVPVAALILDESATGTQFTDVEGQESETNPNVGNTLIEIVNSQDVAGTKAEEAEVLPHMA